MALEVGALTLADVPFGMLLTDAERWHRTPPDWVRLLRLEPEGAFKAVADGIPAGTAAALTFGGFAWIHSMIVLKDLRHRGVGEALMRACLDFVDRRGVVCTKLDSVGGVEPFYARFGFIEEYPSWRLLADGVEGTPKAMRLKAKDYPALFDFDREMAGLDRSRALEAILADYPDRAFLIRRRGKIRGYIIVRRGEWRDPIGPWVADPDDPGAAADLLRSALASTRGKTFRMCVGGYHDSSLRITEELGFTRPDHSTRMYRGKPFEESRACFAMISAEKG